MDGDDCTWDGPTLPQRIDIAGIHMAQDLATVDLRTVDQRVIAQLAALELDLFKAKGIIGALELRILKLEQRNEHADATAEQLGQIPLRIEWMGTSGGILNHEDGV